MISFMTYDDNPEQVEYFTGQCRHCGRLHRYYPESYATPDSELPVGAFDCCDDAR